MTLKRVCDPFKGLNEFVTALVQEPARATQGASASQIEPVRAGQGAGRVVPAFVSSRSTGLVEQFRYGFSYQDEQDEMSV